GVLDPGSLGKLQEAAPLKSQPADHGRRYGGGERDVRISRNLIVGKCPHPAEQRRRPAVSDQGKVILAEHFGQELVVLGRGGVFGRLGYEAVGAQPLGSLLMDLARGRRLQRGKAGNGKLSKE